MLRLALRVVTLGAVAILPFTGMAVQAQSFQEESFLVEVFAGQYQPEPSFLDDETTFGLRGGTPLVGIRLSDYDEDSFTLHAAVGPVIHVSERIYLKPLFRARWFEARDEDETDTEATLALGFKF